MLPRDKARPIGAIYARYSSRQQDSVADQVRKCFEAAVQQGIFVPREFICFDLAVRGYKRKRAGLGQLQDLLEKHAVNVLLVFATNRLFRKIYRSLQFVEEEVVGRSIRCIFVASKVDTADTKSWQMHLQFHGIIDELGVGMYAEHVRAAHEGMFLRLLIVGTIAFGYMGEAIPGLFTKKNKPRQRVVIDPETDKWVIQIFTWYVNDLLSIEEIVRRLNADPNIPLPPKAIGGMWTQRAVRGILTNPKYRGFWEYGKTKSVWLGKQDYRRQVPREEPLKSGQFDELRIVADELWYAAQKRLAEDVHANAGRKPRDGDRKSRPRLLNGLFWCAEHQRTLYVGGAFGKSMYCPLCKRLPLDKRPLYSLLNRELALRLTCSKLAEIIVSDARLVEDVITACQKEAEAAQKPDPGVVAEKKARLEKVNRQVHFLLDNLGETEEDQKETGEKLKEARRERGQLDADLGLLQAAKKSMIVPSAEQVRAGIGDLGEILTAATVGEHDDETRVAREVIKLLTGGRIEVVQQGERQPRQGWLQGRFKVRLLSYVMSKTTGSQFAGDADHGIDVVIDYREALSLDLEATRAKELHDRGLMSCQIAAELGCGRSCVTKLIKHWFMSRGLPVPDGRKRRATLAKKQTDPTLYEQLAEEAKIHWDEGLADVQIAARLGCSPPTVVAAVAHWHTSRGMPVPSHVERQKALVDQMQSHYKQGLMIREIAQSVGMCSRSVTLLLRERFENLGRPMPDGRERRAMLGGKDSGIVGE